MKNYLFLSLKLSFLFIFLGSTLVNGQQLSSSVPLPQMVSNADLFPQKGQFTKVSKMPFAKEYEGQTLFSGDFTSSTIEWKIAGGNWVITPSGTASIRSSKGNPSFLISPVIKLGEGTIELIYQEKYQIEDVYDFGSVWITDNEGKSWRKLHTVYGESDWSETVISLAGYQNKSVRIAFAMYSDQTLDGEGWKVDDVNVKVVERTSRKMSTSSFNARVEAAQAQQASFTATMTSLNSQKFPFIFASVRLDGITETLDQSHFSACENGVLQSDFFEVIPPETGGNTRRADIVFIQDNSGSMSSVQNAVRRSVIDFVNGLDAAGVDFALGLTRFGQSLNRGQPIIEENGNLTPDADFFLNTVYARNRDDGGTEPGFEAIVASASQFAFRSGAQRIFIFIANEPSNGDINATKIQALNTLQQSSVTFNAVIEPIIGGFYDPAQQQEDYGELATATEGGIFNVYSTDFDPILNQIIIQVANNYLVRYRSSNPVLDGTLREVEVKVDYKGERDIATGQYTPGEAPIISLTQTTLDILNQGQAQNSSITIQAEITDAIAPFVKSATLFCKSTNETTYQSIPMSQVGNSDIWEGMTPANKATLPGIDFYITATDGNITSSLPSDDPVTNPFQIAILPNLVPAIAFTPITHLCEGEDLVVKAKIMDNTNQVASAMLFYRGVGQLVYQDKMLSMQGGNNYQTTINAANISANGVEYYIEAEDDLGVKSQYGAPDNPLVALVSKITDVSAGAQTACNPADNTYTQEIMVEYNNPPSGSNLVVNGQFFSITASPQMVTLTQLPSNGNPVDIIVSFSDQCAFTVNNLFDAPESCTEQELVIKSLTLVDAKTDSDFPMYTSIQDGAVINLSGKPKRVDFRANTDPNKVGSVKLVLEGAYHWESVENVSPYVLFDDVNGDYKGRVLGAGSYTLTATPYSEGNLGGIAGTPLQISFEIVFDSEVLSFTLIDAKMNKEIEDFYPLEDGDVIHLSDFRFNWFNIRAEADPEKVGSVKFDLQGPIQWESVENVLPYALFMDDGGNYKGRKLLPGEYTLKATPYSGWKMQGEAGMPLIITFEVVENNGTAQARTSTSADKFLEKKVGAAENIRRNADRLSAYPVPFNDQLTMNVPFNKEVQISLIDLGGRVHAINVYPSGINNTAIETSGLNLARGIYFIKVLHPNGFVQLLKVQKQ